MNIKPALFAAIGALASAASLAAMPRALDWEIGPLIRGRNYSVGMPTHPTPLRSGWSFEFPYPSAAAGHVHYVTTPIASLAGKTAIVLRYRIDAVRGVHFVAQGHPGLPASLSLFFQREGDSWSGKRHPHHRWWSPTASMRQLAPGDYEMRVSLSDGNWTSVNGPLASSHRQAFRDALIGAERIGLVFGSAAGRGHGVYATGRARFTLLSFRLE
jgi:hypothetical protein